MLNNYVIISDLHCGCQLGLCPEEVTVDSGGVYKQNQFQQDLWSAWDRFWEWVGEITHNEPYGIILNGDAIDGRHHNSTTQITHNMADQIKIAHQVLEPRVEKAATYYHIRGTESHVGQSGEFEELLARSLGAIPNKMGQYAQYDLWLRMGERRRMLGHISHHIGTSGSAYYESTALMKELVDAYVEASRWREEPPDFVIRAHRHRCMVIDEPTGNGGGYSAVSPGWQGKTPYVYRIQGGKIAPPQFGGLLLREAPDGVWYITRFVEHLKRGEVVE